MIPKRYLYVLSFGLFLLFIYFSYLTAKETFTQFDFDLTVKIQDKIPRKLDYPFSLLSILGSAEITGIIWLTMVLILLIKRYWLTAITMLSLPIALALEVYGKLFVHHPAPTYLMYRGVISFDLPSHYVPVEYSYPSGHLLRTAFLISFVLTHFLYHSSKKAQLFIFPVLSGLFLTMFVSRIYLGEHWFSDCVGGSLIGISFGIFTALTIPIRKKLHLHNA